MNKYILPLSIIIFLISSLCLISNNLYFPPKTGNDWQTFEPASSGWNIKLFDSLDKFLINNHSKGFIILKDGKIAYEKYYGNFTKDSLWYWASASKTITSVLTGIAQENKILDINDKTSKYLDSGWSSAPPEKEDLITIRNHLTMTTGFNDKVSNDDCYNPECLQYVADACTRWAYHNAAYQLLQKIIENASGQNFNIFTYQNLSEKIGMKGLWVKTDTFVNTYFSKARDMARFGLMVLNHGVWDNDTVLRDTKYFNDMTNTSQDINPSYGYLWWLNGKGKYMLPQSRLVFNMNLIPQAPDDLYAALGKNDQKIYIVESMNLVVIRIGDAAESPLYALSNFDRQLWDLLMKILPDPSDVIEKTGILTNSNMICTNTININYNYKNFDIYNFLGELLESGNYTKSINISNYNHGLYFLKTTDNNGNIKTIKIIKN